MVERKAEGTGAPNSKALEGPGLPRTLARGSGVGEHADAHPSVERGGGNSPG